MPVDTTPSALASPVEASVRQRWGWVVPVACAVHCAAAAFLVALLPGSGGGEEWEWLFLMASGALGWSTVRRLPQERGRGRGAVLALGAGGLLLWTASLLGWTAPVAEAVSSGMGALMLASAMLLGSHSHAAREANACGCSACQTPDDFRHRGRRGYLLEGIWKRE